MSRPIETEKRLVVYWWPKRRGKWRAIANGYKISFEGDENVLNVDHGDGCKLCEHTKTTESHTLNSEFL